MLARISSCSLLLLHQPVYLHVSRLHVHGFGSSRDIRHSLAVVRDVQILHQDIVQNQFFEEPVSIVSRVSSAHPVHPCLHLGRFCPCMRQSQTAHINMSHAAFTAAKCCFFPTTCTSFTYKDIHEHIQSQPALLSGLAKLCSDFLAVLLDEPHDLLHIFSDISHLVLLHARIIEHQQLPT